MSYIPDRTYDLNDTSFDVWGRPKVYLDKSIIHGMWTFDIVDTLWRIYENDSLILLNDLSTKVYSENGMLKVVSGTTLNDSAKLCSKRNPRYQPNRGHLYSTALGLPNKTANAVRDFGLFNDENGVFFRLKSDGNLYACIRTLGIETHEELIDLPASVDVTKGNVYDVQYQWRGVGNYKFFVGVEDKVTLVHEIKFQNILDESLTISNPAMPIAYKCTNLGDEAKIWVGCVDVTSEGGSIENKVANYISTDSNGITISGTSDYAIIAIKIPETYLSRINTRDLVLTRVSTSCNNENVVSFKYTKDPDAFLGTTWQDVGRGNVQYAQGTNIVYNDALMDTIYSSRSEQDFGLQITNPDLNSERYLSAGDFLLVTFKASNGNTAWCTIEWSEEI